MRKLIVPLVIAALLVGVFAVGVNAQATYQRFENVWAKTLRSTGNTTVGGNLNVTGSISGPVAATSLNATGNGSVSGRLVVGDYLAVSGVPYFVTGAAKAVTDGGTITPTEGVVELTAAGAVGAGLATAADGQLVILVNSSANTITITDTGSTKLAGNAALGQDDSLTLVGIGVTWYELARSSN